jgi:hypothetical protein
MLDSFGKINFSIVDLLIKHHFSFVKDLHWYDNKSKNNQTTFVESFIERL